MALITYREAIRRSMSRALAEHDHTLIYGLGVTDHTGIFGTTLGLADEYGPERVFDTPIAEESMTGFAVGAALGGLYPIHVHIRADFLLLAMNQLVNSIAKYRAMYGGLFRLPLLVRAVVGRSWGQGGQHSQSLQALFAHIPGWTVLMPSSAVSVERTYDHIIGRLPGPVISFEHRLLYDYSFEEGTVREPDSPLAARRVRDGGEVTVVASSIMVAEAQRAASALDERGGPQLDIVDLHCVSPIDIEPVVESLSRTRRLIVADSGWASCGICAEVVRLVAERDPRLLAEPPISIAMAATTCPTAKALENRFYANPRDIADAAHRLVTGRRDHGGALPDLDEVLAAYKAFRGPF